MQRPNAGIVVNGGFSGLMGTHERKGMQCFLKLLNQIG